MTTIRTAAAAPITLDLTRRSRPDVPIIVTLDPRATVQQMRLNAAGTGLESFDAAACDWCDTAAAVQVETHGEPSHPDLACDFHLGYWFAAPIAAGEVITVTRLDYRHPRG